MFCYEYPWTDNTVLSGIIDQDTTIGGTIWVTGDVIVQSGVTLTVGPGTQAFVLPMDMNNLWIDTERIEIVISGNLVVNGQAGERVVVRSGAQEPAIGDWVGIMVQQSAQDVDVQYMDLSHADTGIYSFMADIDIDHSTISSCVTGVSVRDAGGLLHDVKVSGCSGSGFYPHGQSGTASVVLDSCLSTNNEYGFYFGYNAGSCEIKNKCRAIGNSEDGIHCRSAMTIGPEVWIEDNGANGIQLIGVGSTGVIDGVTIVNHDAGSGILCLALSSPEIKNCYIADNYDNVSAKYSSLPVLGDFSTSKGMNNSILTPTRYHVANYNKGTTLMAQMCYWGPCGGGQMPAINLYGSVNIVPWLENQPNSPWTAPRFKPEVALENWVSQNYPNPFNPITRIDYQVAEPGDRVILRIFDITGRLVRELVNGEKSSGRYTVEWDGRNQAGTPVATGIYLYRINIGGEFIRTGKLVMMK